jgi:hypothetical protein
VGYTYDNVVHNNVVRYSGESNAYCGKDCVFGGGAPGAGIRVRNTPVTGRNYFYNNILYANSHNFSGTRCASGAFTFMNNLSLNPTVRHLDFAGNDTPACSQYNDFASATADYNLYWPATGTGLFDWHGVYDSFESYASNTGQDAHGLAADPLLTNPVGGDFHWAGTPSIIPGAGDYRLMANSPAIDAGTNVGLTPDIAGNPIGGAPEIGAYEILAPDLVPTMLSVTKSGNKIYVSDTVLNQGNTAAGSFTVAYYLSTDSVFDSATDIALASSPNGSGTCTRAILALDAGTTSSVTNLTCYRPSAMIEGVHYYVLGVIDSANQVVESNETNNVRATSGTIQR